MTLEQRPEKEEGASRLDTWKQSIPNRGNSKCTCPEVGTGMVSLMKSQKVSMAGEKGTKRTAVGDKVKKVAAGQLV